MKTVYLYENNDAFTYDEFEAYIENELKTYGHVRPGYLRLALSPDDAVRMWNRFYRNNRRVTSAKQAEMRNVFEKGHFEENIGAPIALGADGWLKNGHHRITGVSLVDDKSSRFIFEVCIGVNESMNLDTGKRRTVLDNIKMSDAISPETSEILDSPIGKGCNVLAMLNGAKNYGDKISFLFNLGHNAAEELEILSDVISLPLLKNNQLKNAGCLAGIIDLFFRGEINTNEINDILCVGKLYSEANTARINNTGDWVKKEEAAIAFEKEVFGTAQVFRTLINALPMGGSDSLNKKRYYLVTKAVENWKNGDDSPVGDSDSVMFNAGIDKAINKCFNFDDLYKIDIEHVKENNYWHIVQMVA